MGGGREDQGLSDPRKSYEDRLGDGLEHVLSNGADSLASIAGGLNEIKVRFSKLRRATSSNPQWWKAMAPTGTPSAGAFAAQRRPDKVTASELTSIASTGR